MPDFQDKLEILKKGLKSFEFYIPTKTTLELDGLVEEDILEKRQALFLGFFSEEDIFNALKRRNIIRDLKEKGFPNIRVVFKIDDPFHQEVFIYDGEEKPENQLAHFIAREGIIKPKREIDIPEEFRNCEYKVIVIEWLAMQNPREKFSPEKPKLPGQKYPGLGEGRKVIDLLIQLGRNLKKDGLMNFPEFFHNARLYSSDFRFYNPTTEGIFQAIIRDIDDGKHTLSDLSYAIFFDCLIEKKSGKTFKWFREEQILPTSEKFKKYFQSDWYQNKKREAYESHSFTIDWDKFNQIKNSKNIYEVI